MAKTQAKSSGPKWLRVGRIKTSKANKSYIELSCRADTIEAVEEILRRLKAIEASGERGNVVLTLQDPKRDGDYPEPEFVKKMISLPPSE
jgi:hypothetical protein